MFLAVLAGSLAACCFTAAAQGLHGSRVDAVAFALVGWFALTIGMLALIRPTRRLLAVAVAGNAALAIFWLAQILAATHGHPSAAAITRVRARGRDRGRSRRVLLARPALGRALGHLDLGPARRCCRWRWSSS